MKVIAIIFAALWAVVSADLTYNITAASAPGQFDKYKCYTTRKMLATMPKCIHKAQIYANKHDGCAYNDFACHCINYQTYSDIIEPLVFPPEICPEGMECQGACTLPELGVIRPLITDLCNFFNATQYAALTNCNRPLSQDLVLPTIWNEAVNATV